MAKQLREVYGTVLKELGETNQDIVVLDADLSGSTKSAIFGKAYPDRDRLVLSKGHAAPMLYRNLVEKGYLPADAMASLRKTNSELQGHP